MVDIACHDLRLQRAEHGVGQIADEGRRHQLLAAANDADAALVGFGLPTREVCGVSRAPDESGPQCCGPETPLARHANQLFGLEFGASELTEGSRRRLVFVPERTRPVVERHVGARDVYQSFAARLPGRVDHVLGAGDVRPAERVRVGGGVGDAGGVHHGVAVGRGDGQTVWIAQVPDNPFDVLKRSRVRALADIGDHFMAGVLQLANDQRPRPR